MLLHNYADNETYIASLLKSNLASITDSEIQSIKKRVEFYVNHFTISTKKMHSEAKERQLEFLMNLNNLLESEIEDRNVSYAYAYS